jgi:hypothetical protein
LFVKTERETEIGVTRAKMAAAFVIVKESRIKGPADIETKG